jgi:RimJ/RimL family protein N-acetyltransferase
MLDSIEIGSTWLAASAQRTAVNTEAKCLMLVHAFDVLGVHRVVLNTDVRNERSRAAIARIGATFEGVLHTYRYGVEGTPRDTATFAIPVRDWPTVRERLEARLSASS